MKYAKDTEVSVEKTRAEIESTVVKYGASAFGSMWEHGRAVISFQMNNRRLKFVLPLPDRSDKRFAFSPAGRNYRDEAGKQKAWEQSCRQLWRALLLAIRAKLEAVECKISTFDEEFMAHIVMPDGRTIGELVLPDIPLAISGGTSIKLLPGPFSDHLA